MNVESILHNILSGQRMTPNEATFLLSVRGPEVFSIFAAADEIRKRKVGDTVTYVRNMNVHITNICKNLCKFCGFGTRRDAQGAYLFTKEEIYQQTLSAKKYGATEICLLSGVHPDFTLSHYLAFLRWVHDIYPDVHIHAFSPDEIDWIVRQGQLSLSEVLDALKDGGLGTMQGTAAEILVDDVRKVICPAKVSSARWEEIIRLAHAKGLLTSATIMYGSVERMEDRAHHLNLIRSIQDDTQGFTEMVLLSYVHANTPLCQEGVIRFGPSGMDDLVTTAVARLFLDNFDNIQISWPKLGRKITQIALCVGANDLSGTMFQDAVTSEAGLAMESCLEPEEMEHMVHELNRTLQQRSTEYGIIS